MNIDNNDSVYFSKLHLSNVKAFGSNTTLDLTHKGRPAQWTLIVGENGLGKTTLLQCLALMRPVLNVVQSKRTNANPPDRVEPALTEYNDARLSSLARVGDGLQTKLRADFSIGLDFHSSPTKVKRSAISTTATFSVVGNDLERFQFDKPKYVGFQTPLVVAYSAARHAPYIRSELLANSPDPGDALFDPATELIDAGQVLENLDYLAHRKEKRAILLSRVIKQALAKVLPDLNDPSQIIVHGPAIPGVPNKKTGVWIKTYSGEIPLTSLSVGYQSMFSWTVDLAWRMAEHHDKAKNPLVKSAIVLLDELDLHLHPKWQRRVRDDLAAIFPNVQFVITTHSPILAQTFLDANIALMRKDGDHAVIENDPHVLRTWRLDEVSKSLLYGVDVYPPQVAEAFRMRLKLLSRHDLSSTERKALDKANDVISEIPTENQNDSQAMSLIREAANLLQSKVT